MNKLLGEYECKIDGKGRLMFPVALKRKLPEASGYRFVLNRGFEECLMLYPIDTWEKIVKDISKLNLYIKKNRDFLRYFYRGASEVELDGTNRLLIPKRLLKYAEIEKDVMVFAFVDRIEVWNREKYESLLTDEPADYAELAELTMGSNSSNPPEDVP
ncbi:MAG TPA: division/cell wall cluster transcriptional repressor MraZ [Bacteroidales bacterium]|nr:division/cell wall cluster transcriptional repressor MraZ [Bacteroidales bacterium]